MTSRKKKNKKTWSVTRIKHSKYPEITGRVGEFQAGGILHFFLQKNGKQTSRSLKCCRSDLGADKTVQEKEARRLAINYIEALANADEVVESLGTQSSPSRKISRQLLTIGALTDKYEIDGLSHLEKYLASRIALQNLIFREFTRFDPGAVEGSGIGLAISQRLAPALGAAITFKSTRGVGSTFTLWLPSDSPPGMA